MNAPRLRPYVLRTVGEVDPALVECVDRHRTAKSIERRRRILDQDFTELVVGLPSEVDAERIREALLHDARDAGISLAWMAADRAALTPGLLICDLDSTLVDGEGIDLLAAYAGRAEEVAKITEEAMRGRRDFARSLRDRVRVLAGLPEEVVTRTAEDLTLHPGAVEALAFARAKQWKVAIASGGFVPLARAVADRVGADWVRANVLEIRDGFLTGRVAGRIIDGAAKAEFLALCRDRMARRAQTTAKSAPLSVVAMGDGANDLAMLEAADVGIAYRPKPTLLTAARAVCMHHDLRVALALVGIMDTEARP